jgi:hypothetical protein
MITALRIEVGSELGVLILKGLTLSAKPLDFLIQPRSGLTIDLDIVLELLDHSAKLLHLLRKGGSLDHAVRETLEELGNGGGVIGVERHGRGLLGCGRNGFLGGRNDSGGWADGDTNEIPISIKLARDEMLALGTREVQLPMVFIVFERDWPTCAVKAMKINDITDF